MKNVKIILVLFAILASTAIAQKPYTILISFDGFRWDYLDRGITPTLNKFADDGIKASSLRPVFPSKTFPNHLSIITGLYPEHHGIIANYFEDPYSNDTYRLSDDKAVKNSKWYLGEAFWETAERSGIKTASFFWPGSEVELKHRHPTYFKEFDQSFPYRQRIDTVISWLEKPYQERPKFITTYFSLTDTYGHRYGTNSVELNTAITKLDSIANYLEKELKKTGVHDSTNIIILSDHGMTNVSKDRAINIGEYITDYNVTYQGSGPVILITPENNSTDEIFDQLKKNEEHFQVYKKNELPEYFHYNEHPFIPEIIVVADIGWSIFSKKDYKQFIEKPYSGNHGYDNNHLDMHGIFIAKGPSFKNNYKTGTLWNIDIYPLLCGIYNIPVRSTIDGKSERIKFILKEN